MRLEKTRRALVLSLGLILILTFAMATPLAAMAEPAKKREVEKVVFIHYKKGYGKPEGTPGKGPPPKEPKEEDGYKLLRGGVKWAVLPVTYLINTDESDLEHSLVVVEITEAFEAWDAQTSKDLFNYDPEKTSQSGAVQDYVNVVSWVEIEDTYVIAVATIWFYVNTKEMVEFDIVFNSLLDWGIDEDGEGSGHEIAVFDVRNIATHESGHTLVLLDLYQDQYSEMTMYGYSEEGEVKKISLEAGDIAGCQRLYGK